MRKVMLNIWKLVVQIHRTCSIQLKQNRTALRRNSLRRCRLAGSWKRCIHNI